MWLPLTLLLLETWPTTQAHALTGNQTSDLLVLRPALSPLSHTSQGNKRQFFYCILNTFFLAMQKLFILMRSHLFNLSFMSLVLGDMSVRMLLHGMSEIFLPMFSSRTFMMLRQNKCDKQNFEIA